MTNYWPLVVPDDLKIPTSEKRILGGGSDLNALHPAKYGWAWQSYLDMQENRWRPTEIGMGDDRACWMSDKMTDLERRVYWAVFGMLTSFDLLRARDISDSLKPIAGAAEIRQALTEQEEQEALHSESYQYCIDQLGFEHDWVYGLYRAYPALKERMDFAEGISNRFSDWHNDIDMATLQAGSFQEEELARELLVAASFWYLCFEGVWFLAGLSGPVQLLARRGMMTKTAEQFQLIARDENTHVRFGIDLINELKKEVPAAWDEDTKERIKCNAVHAIQLEYQFINFALPEPILGYSAEGHMDLAKSLMNRQLESVGLPAQYPNCNDPYPWIDEQMGTKKEKNFFESRVTDYRVGADLNFPDKQSTIDGLGDWMQEE